MSITKEELINQVFHAGLITLRAVSISMVSKKAMGGSLGVPSTGLGILKMTAAIASGTMLI